MNQQVKDRYEQLFLAAKQLAADLHKSPLADDVSRLWELFTQKRHEEDAISDYFRDPALRRAYIGYYVPVYAAKIGLLLHQMQQEGRIKAQDKVRVLDLGAGPLVGVLATYVAFGRVDSAVCVDRRPGAMQLGIKLIRQYLKAEIGPIELITESLTAPRTRYEQVKDVNIAIIAHTLNEIGGRQGKSMRLGVVQRALGTLAKEGRLLVVEPAHEDSALELMRLRDTLIFEERAHIVAPCTGADRCPLLQLKKTWCHMETVWDKPATCDAIDKRLGFSKEVLKSSYLLLARRNQEPTWPLLGKRVVSGRMYADGVERRYVCTAKGRETLEARADLKRAAALKNMVRGDFCREDI